MKIENEDHLTAVQVRVLLQTGHAAPKSLCDGLRLQIEEIIPAMLPGESYTVAMMCHPEFWCQLEEYERQLSGRFVADMVYRGMLPLVCAGRTPANAKLYKLK